MDGGLKHLDTLSIIPDVIIGDMDSVSSEMLSRYFKTSHIFTYPVEKDKTDAELALDWCLDNNVKELIFVSSFDGRADQLMSHFILLRIAATYGINAEIRSNSQRVLLMEYETLLEVNIGDTVSLIPHSKEVTGVTTSGLKYPLKGETLFSESTRGISNVAIAKKVKISFTDGLLYVMVIN